MIGLSFVLGRQGGGLAIDSVKKDFDLINENDYDVQVRSKFPESWMFITKEIG